MKKEVSAKEMVYDLVKEQAVVLLPGEPFGSSWKNFVRFSFGNVIYEDAIEALDRIERYCKTSNLF